RTIFYPAIRKLCVVQRITPVCPWHIRLLPFLLPTVISSYALVPVIRNIFQTVACRIVHIVTDRIGKERVHRKSFVAQGGMQGAKPSGVRVAHHYPYFLIADVVTVLIDKMHISRLKRQ